MRRYAAVLGALAWSAAALAADPQPVSIRTDAAGPSTRVVLTFTTRKAGCSVAEDTARIKIACESPLAVDPPASSADDGIPKGWSVDHGVLFLAAGRGYTKFDSFELKNPARLVIDLYGTRTSAAAAAAPAPGAQSVIVIDPGHGGVETGAVGP